MAGTNLEGKKAHAAEAKKVTAQRLERDFMNADTPFDRWKVFQETLNWALTASELYENAQWQITEGRHQ